MLNFTQIDELDLLDLEEMQRDRIENEVDAIIAELDEDEEDS